MVSIRKGTGAAGDLPGTWYPWSRHGERPVIDIMCPKCGKSFFLEQGERFGVDWEAHGVSAEGIVSPSVICPFCGFHDHVLLIGWEFGYLREVG
jgi:hypothetical protein